MAAPPPLPTPPDPRLAGDWEVDVPPADLPPEPEPEPVPPTQPVPVPNSDFRIPQSPDPPPAPGQLVEAMLFVGGPPLTAAAACAAIRGLTADGFRAAVDALN